jgi:hypothetical protein
VNGKHGISGDWCERESIMKLSELITHFQKMIEENPKLANAKVEVAYQGSEGCETCGWGGKENHEIEAFEIFDMETKVVIDIA